MRSKKKKKNNIQLVTDLLVTMIDRIPERCSIFLATVLNVVLHKFEVPSFLKTVTSTLACKEPGLHLLGPVREINAKKALKKSPLKAINHDIKSLICYQSCYKTF